MNVPTAPAGYLSQIVPFAAESIEIRASLAVADTVASPVRMVLPYPVRIVSVKPSICAIGDRTGKYVPTADDIDVSIESNDDKYNFMSRVDEGLTTPTNQRVSLVGLDATNRYFQLLLGSKNPNNQRSELLFQFGWKHPTTALTYYVPVLVSLVLGIERLDAPRILGPRGDAPPRRPPLLDRLLRAGR